MDLQVEETRLRKHTGRATLALLIAFKGSGSRRHLFSGRRERIFRALHYRAISQAAFGCATSDYHTVSVELRLAIDNNSKTIEAMYRILIDD